MTEWKKRDNLCLFNICLRYIHINSNLLNSLCGFPDIVGKQLFTYMHANQDFYVDNQTGCFSKNGMKTLKLFSEAYGSQVMECLSLAGLVRSKHLSVPTMVECFQGLVQLDLSNCVVNNFLSDFSKFLLLEKLVLRKTNLNDNDFKKLTLPYRLFKERSNALKILDISENYRITFATIQHVSAFVNLLNLNVSNTSFNINPKKISHLNEKGWVISTDASSFLSVINKGWGKCVIEDVLQWDEAQHSTASNNVSRFYRNKNEEANVDYPEQLPLILQRTFRSRKVEQGNLCDYEKQGGNIRCFKRTFSGISGDEDCTEDVFALYKKRNIDMNMQPTKKLFAHLEEFK